MQDHNPAEIDPDSGEIIIVIETEGADGADAGEQAQPAPGVGAEAALRLDKRTYLDKEQGHYRANLIDYGGGLCEVGWSFVSIRPAKPSALRGESEARTDNESRAARRAKSTIRKKVLSYGLDHLLTLTYRSNVTDFELASSHLSRFIRLLKDHYKEFPYVAVPEKQARGAWHWHLAVKGRQDVNLLRQLWLKTVGEGNIDVQQPKRGQNRRLALVKYLSKYLTKGFDSDQRELNGHRFRASHGLALPIEPVTVPEEARRNVQAYILERLQARGGKVGFTWKSDQGMAGWACSWD